MNCRHLAGLAIIIGLVLGPASVSTARPGESQGKQIWIGTVTISFDHFEKHFPLGGHPEVYFTIERRGTETIQSLANGKALALATYEESSDDAGVQCDVPDLTTTRGTGTYAGKAAPLSVHQARGSRKYTVSYAPRAVRLTVTRQRNFPGSSKQACPPDFSTSTQETLALVPSVPATGTAKPSATTIAGSRTIANEGCEGAQFECRGTTTVTWALRRKPPQSAPTGAWKVDVVAKSYIAPIGTNFGVVAGGDQGKLVALALATDLGFSENPQTNAKDHQYRLYSSESIVFECVGSHLTGWAILHDSDTGTEPAIHGLFQPPPGIFFDETDSRTSGSTVEYHWSFKGRPHLAVEPGFQAVRLRTSVYIWHKVSVTVSCTRAAKFTWTAHLDDGSKFPSHRLWVRGQLVQTVAQGPFSNLWIPDPSDPFKVA